MLLCSARFCFWKWWLHCKVLGVWTCVRCWALSSQVINVVIVLTWSLGPLAINQPKPPILLQIRYLVDRNLHSSIAPSFSSIRWVFIIHFIHWIKTNAYDVMALIHSTAHFVFWYSVSKKWLIQCAIYYSCKRKARHCKAQDPFVVADSQLESLHSWGHRF